MFRMNKLFSAVGLNIDWILLNEKVAGGEIRVEGMKF